LGTIRAKGTVTHSGAKTKKRRIGAQKEGEDKNEV